MLKVNNICKRFDLFSLKNISFTLLNGEKTAILGKVGSGKTLLLEIIMGLIKPDNGEIFIDTECITNQSIQDRDIGFLFQKNLLFPHLNVKDNLLFALKNSKKFKKTEYLERLNFLIETLNIKNILYNYPATLSGGESKKVAIARTLVTNHSYLILDEPYANLDIEEKNNLRSFLENFLINYAYTAYFKKPTGCIIVSHEYDDIVSISDKVIVLDRGEIVHNSSFDEFIKNKNSDFVCNFIKK